MPLKAKKTSNLRRDNVTDGTRAAAKPVNATRLRKIKEDKGTKSPAKPVNASSPSPPGQSKHVPLELQQRLLDVFRDACSASLNDKLSGTIQEIKQCLFERDFAGAFSKAPFLEAYAARWSPTRALTYLDILCNLPALSNRFSSTTSAEGEDLEIEKILESLSTSSESTADRTPVSGASSPPPPETLEAIRRQRIVCLGAGGGAELVSFAGYLHQSHIRAIIDRPPADNLAPSTKSSSVLLLHAVFVDIADWSSIFTELYSTATSTPPSPEYASEVEKSNPCLVNPPDLTVEFVQQDVLRISRADLGTTVGQADLVTIMFTLNELYSTSMSSATKLLLSLTSLLQAGAFLLVVDSPGSYSTVNLGKPASAGEAPKAGDGAERQKQYPMKWLLDHTLLETASINDPEHASKAPISQWRKVESEDSKWFRLSPQLKYPIGLEDMRYQLHLYERL